MKDYDRKWLTKLAERDKWDVENLWQYMETGLSREFFEKADRKKWVELRKVGLIAGDNFSPRTDPGEWHSPNIHSGWTTHFPKDLEDHTRRRSVCVNGQKSWEFHLDQYGAQAIAIANEEKPGFDGHTKSPPLSPIHAMFEKGKSKFYLLNDSAPVEVRVTAKGRRALAASVPTIATTAPTALAKRGSKKSVKHRARLTAKEKRALELYTLHYGNFSQMAKDAGVATTTMRETYKRANTKATLMSSSSRSVRRGGNLIHDPIDEKTLRGKGF